MPAHILVGQPELDAAVIPGTTDAVLRGAPAGGFAALALGTALQRTPLPGGAALDFAPEAFTSYAPIGAGGIARLTAHFPIGTGAGAHFFAQAVVLAPGRAIGQLGALAVTPRRLLRVPALDEEADVLIAFGQSNMAGQASLAELPFAHRIPNPAVRIWQHADATWPALTAGVNNTTLPQPGWVGPELALTRNLLAGERTLWLCKCAIGQTSLGPTPGPWNEWGCRAGELYAEMLRRIDAATTALRALRLRPRVRGICMMQGENDALDATLAAGYRDRLSDLIATLRGDLANRGLTTAPAVPFALGLVHEGLAQSGAPHAATVRAAQIAAAATLPACATVETSAMARQADGVHLATAGVEALGAALATALRQLGAF